MIISVGAKVNDRYEILSALGEGGFGTVFHARDLSLNREVALKVLKPDTYAPELFARIRRECKLLARLSHPNIVGIYAIELMPDETPIIVMEYLNGKSLKTAVAEQNNGLPEAGCREIFMQICAGLSHAHKHAVIHRDLSPANIILLADSTQIRVKLIDFGLSKAFLKEKEKPDSVTTMALTKTGALVGNPAYMSPEACLGGRLDKRSDIYSLGCTLYEMLTGSSMFEIVEPIGLLYKQQNEYPAKPVLNWTNQNEAGVFLDILLRCLQKDPEKRPESVESIVLALQESSTSGFSNKELEDWGCQVLKAESSGARSKLKSKFLALCAISFLLLCAGTFFLVPGLRKNKAELEINAVKLDPQLQRLKTALQKKEALYGKEHRSLMKPLKALTEYYLTSKNPDRQDESEHLKRILEIANKHKGFDDDKAMSLCRLSSIYQDKDPALAESCIKQALDIINNIQGKKNPRYLEALKQLAEIYGALKKNKEAEATLKNALSIANEPPCDNNLIINSLDWLGNFYLKERRYTQAIAMHKKSLNHIKTNYGMPGREKYTIENQLTQHFSSNEQEEEVYFQQAQYLCNALLQGCKYDELEKFCREQLELLKVSNLSSERKTELSLSFMQSLAWSKRNRKDLPAARNYIEELISIERKFGKPANICARLLELAEVYRDSYMYKEAIECCSEALKISENATDTNPVIILECQKLLASCQNELGLPAKFSESLLSSIKQLERVEPRDYWRLALYYQQSAEQYEKQGKYKKAKRNYEKAIENARSLDKPDYGRICACTHGLAKLAVQQKFYAEAESLQKNALDCAEKYLSVDEIRWQTRMLAEIYGEQGKHAQARKLIETEISKYDESSLNDENRAYTYAGLADSFKSEKKYKNAEEYFQKAAKVAKRHGNNKIYAEQLFNLGRTYYEQGKYEPAEVQYKNALQAWLLVYGKDTPEMRDCLSEYADTLKHLGKIAEAETMDARCRMAAGIIK